MKNIVLIVLIFCSYFNANSQENKDTKAQSDSLKLNLKDLLNSKALLSDAANKSCACIDSISTTNKNAKDNALEIKKCIDKQVIIYQSTSKLMEALLSIENTNSKKVSINVNTNSKEYQQYYFEIEKQLMDSCAAIKSVVGANDKENEKSVSNNIEAKEEYSKGNKFLEKEDYAKALPFYERAVKIDPEFAFAWDNIGVCYRRLGDYDKALDAYEKSLKIDPKGMLPLQNIPVVYIYQKKYKKAIKAYENLAEIDEKNPEIYYGIGIIYYQNLNENEKSLDYLCKAYKLYIEQNSPYRTDAEKIINMLYKAMKEEGKEKEFNKILEDNNISQSKK